ncbi:acetyltransferase, GNAT family protein [Besnoitia besnoiti]|uniref:Acetyltransferase, GNAT family protein n=1 Tax=Besnoitia besnoiti TaxID=94643 RepID=A0A2A9MPG2_BESBE|nr:acetyltransferase, GNAT family protein [Besnoitia besnoiti]PFH37927.1 acetyltransferase, GNAT family protein [Besnoitia besnoiti]
MAQENAEARASSRSASRDAAVASSTDNCLIRCSSGQAESATVAAQRSSLRFLSFPSLVPVAAIAAASRRLDEQLSAPPPFASGAHCASLSVFASADCRQREMLHHRAEAELLALEKTQLERLQARESREQEIHRLLRGSLSEPYSIYTLRHFLHGWPQLTVLAYDGAVCAGVCVCKLDMKSRRRRSESRLSLRTASERRLFSPHGCDRDRGVAEESKEAGWVQQERLSAGRCNAVFGLFQRDEEEESVRKGYIGMLAVLPAYRRRGLGSRLVECVLSRMERKNGISEKIQKKKDEATGRVCARLDGESRLPCCPEGSGREEESSRVSSLRAAAAAHSGRPCSGERIEKRAEREADTADEEGDDTEPEGEGEEAKAKTQKIVSCRIETEAVNTGALRLYESLSFVRVARMQRFYLNESDAFKLTRSFEDERFLPQSTSGVKGQSRFERIQSIIKTSSCWW